MVVLAAAVKACRRASSTYGSVMIVPQVMLMLAWMPTRLLFLILEAAAKSMHWAETQPHRNVEVVE
jgi:hypothetical protein